MGEVEDDEPKWLTAIYVAGWTFLWLAAAAIMLACLFGLILVNW